MSDENSLERGIRIKIGLIFLIIALYFAGVLAYSLRLKTSIDEQSQNVDTSYRILAQTGNLINSVQQAQDLMNSYLLAPQDMDRQLYDSISNDILQQIATIKKESILQDQNRLLDNIDSLLVEKNEIVGQLIRQFKAQNPLKKVDKKIDTSYSDIVKDSVSVTTYKDTTIVVKKEKNFWSRLKGVFNPKHAPDTTITITRTKKDTVLTSKADTLFYKDLKDITHEAALSYSSNIRDIEKQVQNLIQAEQSISLQISELLTQLYDRTVEVVKLNTSKNENLTQKIFLFAVAVGAFSLLLVATIILFIVKDLNRGQRARRELAEEKRLTESLMESRHKLLLSISHDMKTPLSSIMGYLEMWSRQESDPEKKHQMISAQSSGKYMLNMLSNLLEFSRLEQNSGTLNISRFDLIELVEEVVEMFRPLIEEKKLEIVFENLAEPTFPTDSDYTVVKQILTNVVSNAVKYTTSGSIHITLEHHEKVLLTITDTGIGIDNQNIDKIFKPFSRMENGLKTEGSGFGMYVTKGLVESLHGNISVKSQKGKGTQVTIEFPFERMETPNIHPEDAVEKREPELRNILIFEDDAPLGNMISEYLKKRGCKVILCRNAEETDRLLNQISNFDIVFTDMEMIGITGKDILEAIRRRDSRIPVWIMTAHDDYSMEQASKDGFDGLITKPIRLNRLDQILHLDNISEIATPINQQFPALASLFGDDEATIREILANFVETSENDTKQLLKLIEKDDFENAQRLCHKMHPFLAQLNADYLCDVLIKMDKLRGQNESAYPNWKNELAETVKKVEKFTELVKINYLKNGK